jgi:tetratricopeptide (TPR) repeat protein
MDNIPEEQLKIDLLRSMLKDNPHDAELHQELGRAFYVAKLTDEAKEAYEKSLVLDNTDGFTHLYLGNWYFTEEEYAKAKEEFEIARDLMPEDATPVWCLAQVFEAEGDFIEADALFRKAVSIDPDDPQARRYLDQWIEEGKNEEKL